MRRNDIVRITIDSLGSDAQGVGRYNGHVVFVPGALPGEDIDALIVKPMKGYAFGKLLKNHTTSPERVTPPCSAHGRCGGCSCQHMTYEASLRFKQDQVQNCLSRIGGITLPVPLPVAMETPWRYRNKTTMPVTMRDGQPVAGFFARRSHRVVPVEDCLLSDEGSNQAVRTVLAWMQQYNVPAYDEDTHTGLVRHIMVRNNHINERMVVLITAQQEVPKQAQLVDALRAQVPGLVSVCHSVQDNPDNVILGDTYRTLWGLPRLAQNICGISCTLSPLSFFQVNTPQAENLYRLALEMAAPTQQDLVADLYSGAGTITLLLAQHARHAVGIEASPDATRDALDNAMRNGIANVRFINDLAERALPQLVKEGFQPDIVVLDPPRKGADASVLHAIAQAAPRRIVYISCNPATQARDAKILTELSYQATACQPVDLFCQTADVENILLLEHGSE
jgi:23S rRNA (uracil1939-C5)-methyltransferase